MKQTIIQTQCDACGKPTRMDEIVIHFSGRNRKTLDLCPRHMRKIVQILKLSTPTSGRIETYQETVAREARDRSRDPDVAAGEASVTEAVEDGAIG